MEDKDIEVEYDENAYPEQSAFNENPDEVMTGEVENIED